MEFFFYAALVLMLALCFGLMIYFDRQKEQDSHVHVHLHGGYPITNFGEGAINEQRGKAAKAAKEVPIEEPDRSKDWKNIKISDSFDG